MLSSQPLALGNQRFPVQVRLLAMCRGKLKKRKLSQLVNVLLKTFLKHIKSFICESLGFLIKRSIDEDEDIEIVTFEVISLYRSIPHEFGFEGLNYFLITY